MITLTIDEITPCLKDTRTGELADTEVIRLKRKSFLKKYNEKNGWFVNWSKLLDVAEIYALVLKGTVDIQGLIAISPDSEKKAVYINWMCASPENCPLITKQIRYKGIGGHLFSIAIDKSIGYGYGGAVYGRAMNKDILEHYINSFNAVHLPVEHPFQFIIEDEVAVNILKEYSYEWNQLEEI